MTYPIHVITPVLNQSRSITFLIRKFCPYHSHCSTQNYSCPIPSVGIHMDSQKTRKLIGRSTPAGAKIAVEYRVQIPDRFLRSSIILSLFPVFTRDLKRVSNSFAAEATYFSIRIQAIQLRIIAPGSIAFTNILFLSQLSRCLYTAAIYWIYSEYFDSIATVFPT